MATKKATKVETPIRKGQVWRDKDPRMKGLRTIFITGKTKHGSYTADSHNPSNVSRGEGVGATQRTVTRVVLRASTIRSRFTLESYDRTATPAGGK